ncbi:hypothetical protein RFI_19429, partial [Reticulomyxa filosa]
MSILVTTALIEESKLVDSGDKSTEKVEGEKSQLEQKIAEGMQFEKTEMIPCKELNGNERNNESIDIFPKRINVSPMEHQIILSKADNEYMEALSQKYKKKLTTTFAHQPDLLLRFVLGYSHEK